ncbi:hypothetical protein [uncultured Rikenella sp.]|uniref:hypothetical protein n=1 Tax=uncultured Rikenella sp. TaxID=368003 RepID=UPI0026068B4C|nr:hypothetical protein [uncultured Rikenella sp.]
MYDRQHPAPGYRERANGTLSAVGNEGNSRSSTVDNTNSMYLVFNTTVLYPSHTTSRAYALQLRCLSE